MPGRRGRLLPMLVGLLLVLATSPAAQADPTPDPVTPAPPITDAPTTVPGSTTVAAGGTGGTDSTVPGGVTTTSAPPVSVPPGGFGGPPPTEPGTPPGPPIPDTSPDIRILLDQVLVANRQKVVAVRQSKLDQVAAVEQGARAQVVTAQAAVVRAQRSVAAAQARIREDAIVAYVDPGSSGFEAIIDANSQQNRPRAVLLSVTIAHEKRVITAARAVVRTRQAIVVSLQQAAGTAAAHTAAARQSVDQAQQGESDQRAELNEALSGDQTWSLPIRGSSVFRPSELVGWFAQHAVASRAAAPMSDLAYDYIKEGRDEGVRGDMAFAQSVLETGSFTNDDTVRLNNFAGIGHCDTCKSGFAFATPRLGVRAQIQLLKGYAEARPTYKNPLVDSRLHGPAGCCQTWRQLTHTWATAPNYGAALMQVYRQMLYWLVLHRGITPDVAAG